MYFLIVYEKKSRVTRYLETQRETGEKVSHNSHILHSFKRLNRLYQNNSYGTVEYIKEEASIANIFVTKLDYEYVSNFGEIIKVVSNYNTADMKERVNRSHNTTVKLKSKPRVDTDS